MSDTASLASSVSSSVEKGSLCCASRTAIAKTNHNEEEAFGDEHTVSATHTNRSSSHDYSEDEGSKGSDGAGQRRRRVRSGGSARTVTPRSLLATPTKITSSRRDEDDGSPKSLFPSSTIGEDSTCRGRMHPHPPLHIVGDDSDVVYFHKSRVGSVLLTSCVSGQRGQPESGSSTPRDPLEQIQIVCSESDHNRAAEGGFQHHRTQTAVFSEGALPISSGDGGRGEGGIDAPDHSTMKRVGKHDRRVDDGCQLDEGGNKSAERKERVQTENSKALQVSLRASTSVAVEMTDVAYPAAVDAVLGCLFGSPPTATTDAWDGINAHTCNSDNKNNSEGLTSPTTPRSPHYFPSSPNAHVDSPCCDSPDAARLSENNFCAVAPIDAENERAMKEKRQEVMPIEQQPAAKASSYHADYQKLLDERGGNSNLVASATYSVNESQNGCGGSAAGGGGMLPRSVSASRIGGSGKLKAQDVLLSSKGLGRYGEFFEDDFTPPGTPRLSTSNSQGAFVAGCGPTSDPHSPRRSLSMSQAGGSVRGSFHFIRAPSLAATGTAPPRADSGTSGGHSSPNANVLSFVASRAASGGGGGGGGGGFPTPAPLSAAAIKRGGPPSLTNSLPFVLPLPPPPPPPAPPLTSGEATILDVLLTLTTRGAGRASTNGGVNTTGEAQRQQKEFDDVVRALRRQSWHGCPPRCRYACWCVLTEYWTSHTLGMSLSVGNRSFSGGGGVVANTNNASIRMSNSSNNKDEDNNSEAASAEPSVVGDGGVPQLPTLNHAAAPNRLRRVNEYRSMIQQSYDSVQWNIVLGGGGGGGASNNINTNSTNTDNSSLIVTSSSSGSFFNRSGGGGGGAFGSFSADARREAMARVSTEEINIMKQIRKDIPRTSIGGQFSYHNASSSSVPEEVYARSPYLWTLLAQGQQLSGGAMNFTQNAKVYTHAKESYDTMVKKCSLFGGISTPPAASLPNPSGGAMLSSPPPSMINQPTLVQLGSTSSASSVSASATFNSNLARLQRHNNNNSEATATVSAVATKTTPTGGRAQQQHKASAADGGGSPPSRSKRDSTKRKDAPKQTNPFFDSEAISKQQLFSPLFRHVAVQQMLQRVLYLWALRHPACGYVQGMNDLLVPIVVTVLAEGLCYAGLPSEGKVVVVDDLSSTTTNFDAKVLDSTVMTGESSVRAQSHVDASELNNAVVKGAARGSPSPSSLSLSSSPFPLSPSDGRQQKAPASTSTSAASLPKKIEIPSSVGGEAELQWVITASVEDLTIRMLERGLLKVVKDPHPSTTEEQRSSKSKRSTNGGALLSSSVVQSSSASFGSSSVAANASHFVHLKQSSLKAMVAVSNAPPPPPAAIGFSSASSSSFFSPYSSPSRVGAGTGGGGGMRASQTHSTSTIPTIAGSSLYESSLWFALEADVYFLFCRLMDTIQVNFTADAMLRKADIGGVGSHGTSPSISTTAGGMHAMVSKLEDIVRRAKPRLHHILTHQLKLQFTFFAFRWMNCMLQRELCPSILGMRLLDTYFSEFSNSTAVVMSGAGAGLGSAVGVGGGGVGSGGGGGALLHNEPLLVASSASSSSAILDYHCYVCASLLINVYGPILFEIFEPKGVPLPPPTPLPTTQPAHHSMGSSRNFSFAASNKAEQLPHSHQQQQQSGGGSNKNSFASASTMFKDAERSKGERVDCGDPFPTNGRRRSLTVVVDDHHGVVGGVGVSTEATARKSRSQSFSHGNTTKQHKGGSGGTPPIAQLTPPSPLAWDEMSEEEKDLLSSAVLTILQSPALFLSFQEVVNGAAAEGLRWAGFTNKEGGDDIAGGGDSEEDAEDDEDADGSSATEVEGDPDGDLLLLEEAMLVETISSMAPNSPSPNKSSNVHSERKAAGGVQYHAQSGEGEIPTRPRCAPACSLMEAGLVGMGGGGVGDGDDEICSLTGVGSSAGFGLVHETAACGGARTSNLSPTCVSPLAVSAATLAVSNGAAARVEGPVSSAGEVCQPPALLASSEPKNEDKPFSDPLIAQPDAKQAASLRGVVGEVLHTHTNVSHSHRHHRHQHVRSMMALSRQVKDVRYASSSPLTLIKRRFEEILSEAFVLQALYQNSPAQLSGGGGGGSEGGGYSLGGGGSTSSSHKVGLAASFANFVENIGKKKTAPEIPHSEDHSTPQRQRRGSGLSNSGEKNTQPTSKNKKEAWLSQWFGKK